MKNFIFTTLMAATTVFAEPSIEISIPPVNLELPPDVKLQEIPVSKQGFFYVRFAAAESDFANAAAIVPGLGIGYRRLAGDGAADISVSGLGHAERKSGRLFWSAPKASYIHYLKPEGKQSSYVGGGLAWGGIESREQKFIGIVPSATFGYEFARKTAVLGFAELNVSQPAIAVYKTGSFPGPVAECTVGIGF